MCVKLGLGFQVQGFKFRVEGFEGFRVAGFRVEGLRAEGVALGILIVRPCPQVRLHLGVAFGIYGLGFSSQDFGYGV